MAFDVGLEVDSAEDDGDGGFAGILEGPTVGFPASECLLSIGFGGAVAFASAPTGRTLILARASYTKSA